MLINLLDFAYPKAMSEINDKYDSDMNKLRDEYLTEKNKISCYDTYEILSLQGIYFSKLKELSEKYFNQLKTIIDNDDACEIQPNGD